MYLSYILKRNWESFGTAGLQWHPVSGQRQIHFRRIRCTFFGIGIPVQPNMAFAKNGQVVIKEAPCRLPLPLQNERRQTIVPLT